MTDTERLIEAETKYLRQAHLAGRLLEAQEHSRFFERNKEITHKEYMRRVETVEGVLVQFYVEGKLLGDTIRAGGSGDLIQAVKITR